MSDFFSADFLNTTQDEIIKKEQEMGGDKREKVPAGVHELVLCKVETDTSDGGVPIVKLVFNKDADQKTFRDLTKQFWFDESDAEKCLMNKKIFVETFYKGFGYSLKQGDLKNAVSQIKKFEGKKVKGAVRIKQKLFKKYVLDEEGNKTSDILGYNVSDISELWYIGKIDAALEMKKEKQFVKLDTKDLETYEDHKAEHPELYDENGKLKFEDAATDSNSSDAESTSEGTSKPAKKAEAEDLPW
jgi:hypothetical protein